MAEYTDLEQRPAQLDESHLSSQSREQPTFPSEQKQEELSFPKENAKEHKHHRMRKHRRAYEVENDSEMEYKEHKRRDNEREIGRALKEPGKNQDVLTDSKDRNRRRHRKKKQKAYEQTFSSWHLTDHQNVKLSNRSIEKDLNRSHDQNIATTDKETDEKIFPTSFPEGTTHNLIYFLQTKRYVLDDESCSPNVKLLNKNRPDSAQRQVSKKTTDAIRGSIGFRDGIHVFEFSFNDKPWGTQCTVGVCAESVPMHTAGYVHMIGDSALGWVWDIPSRTLHHDGKITGQFPDNPDTEIPRTFRMTLARDQGLLAFNIGGSNTVVFKDMPDSSVVLYPVISMVYGLAEVTVTVRSSDLLDKYMWLPRAANRAQKQHKGKPGRIKHDINKDKSKGGEEKVDTIKVIPVKDTIADGENETAISIRAKLEGDVVGYDSYRREQEESSADEDKDYDVETMRVDSLEEEDQLLFHTAHAWDNTNKGSLIQPYPNAPHICVPMPNFDSRIQGIRSRRGFSGHGIHTWMIKELIIYTPSVLPEQMAYQRNNVIIGVATKEQRKFNFGYGLGEVGNEIWGFQYPDLKIWHGQNSYQPQPGPKNPDQINLEGFDFELANGLEITLNTVRNRLTFVYDGKVLVELKHVKGEKLYPFAMYVKDAFYPLEINYVEGPRDYFEDILMEMHGISIYDIDEINNKRILMKRSSSMKENQDNLISREKYIWGCHSEGIDVVNKNTVHNPGVAVAAHPLGGSRHKLTFHVDGTTKGFSIGFVHYGYPLQPVVQDELEYLGNDLLSWCWDIDKRELLHACRVISKYPLDESFDQDDVIAYTMVLDFTPLGNNTASFIAHLDTKDKATKDLGIAFITLPPKVLPTVVIKGTNQKIRMEYTAGPWRTTGLSIGNSRNLPPADATSRTCTIM